MPRRYQQSAAVNSKFAAYNWLQISCIKTFLLTNSSFTSCIFICFLLAFLVFRVCKFNNNNNSNNNNNNNSDNNSNNNSDSNTTTKIYFANTI